ncbi:hypothetical protein H5410_062959 [Solanum commersonii]|uniref:Uncharacterized protein n=1 Tax=Solanum commersonii TaxID=4109 RepID=A0A9J5WC18_SOLCO|nr:hypothetical protein H5410_062959 [Solanum commersonii]
MRLSGEGGSGLCGGQGEERGEMVWTCEEMVLEMLQVRRGLDIEVQRRGRGRPKSIGERGIQYLARTHTSTIISLLTR